ncbi:MAG: squalene/phytoene synthase family protein [Candidatus Anstonellaceae archaeon]
MTTDEQRCWEVLPKVSRSFALAIKMLPDPLKIQLNVAYLIYRTIDTIEDSKMSILQKKKYLDMLISNLENPKYEQNKIERLKIFLLSVPCTYEKVLLQNIESVIRVFYNQPSKIRRSILKWGKIMKEGMMKFQTKKIKTLDDQNRYSYYVAGVVGKLFNELLYLNKIISKKTKKKLSTYAKGFGIALQKINIIRDIRQDIKEKRYFWPINLLKKYSLDYNNIFKKENRESAIKILKIMLKNTKKDIDDAIKYIKALPKNQIKIRIFCLIPLFMALESYAALIKNQKLFELEEKVKIGRRAVYSIALKAALVAESNSIIYKWFVEKVNKSFAPNYKKHLRG